MSTNNARRTSRRPEGQASPVDGDQTLADGDQTLADGDQTGADRDQTEADVDQVSADRDQAAADCDQAASDRDLAAGGEPDTYQASRGVRERTRSERDQTAQLRVDAAGARDEIATARDLAAGVRDRIADARDLALTQMSNAYRAEARARGIKDVDGVARGAARLHQAVRLRALAAEARAFAARDRAAAAADRDAAAAERLHAHARQAEVAGRLVAAETDRLTGARMRGAGLDDLQMELDRSGRAASSLVVAYVDVVGLKALNDTLGHAAGDALLVRVVDLIRSHLRSYDLVVRLGGDEFLCVMSDTTLDGARERFGAIDASLATAPTAGAIRTGFADWSAGETVAELIERADRQLVRVARGNTRPPSAG